MGNIVAHAHIQDTSHATTGKPGPADISETAVATAQVRPDCKTPYTMWPQR